VPVRGPSLAAAVRATSMMTLASRLGGLIRDVLIGRIFGATALNSAFAAAFAIPNMFRRLFGEGALSAAFIPEYTRASTEDPSRAGPGARLASLTLAALAAITILITLVAELALLAVLTLIDHDPDRRLLLGLVMVMLPFMPLICIVAILAGMLQVHGRFAAAASGPVILNGFIIAVGLWCVLTKQLGDARIAFAFGVATVLSAGTQLLWFLRLLRPHVQWTRAFTDAKPRARTVLRRFIPVAIGLGALQLSTFLDTLIATFPIWYGTEAKNIAFPLDDASNGILTGTARVYQFPLGVFGIAVASAAFPLLARHAGDKHLFTHTLRRGLRLSLFIGLPASLGLILIRHDAMAVMYGYGKTGWSADGLARASAVLLGFAPGVWAYSLNHVLTRAFYARGDTRTPMRIALATVALNLVLNLALIWTLRSEAGMAWATSIAATAQCAALALIARRRLTDGPLLDGPSLRAVVKIVLASAAMTLIVWAGLRLFPEADTWRHRLAAVALATGLGLAAYLGCGRLLRIQELHWLFRRGAE
jgi:putative peptidoglycan lipid II flippase